MEEELEHGQGENLIIVYKAPDEVTANVVRGLLTSEDIPAVLESRMIPWMDGVMKMGEGYWGDVVVPEEYVEQSRQIIEAYEADNQQDLDEPEH